MTDSARYSLSMRLLHWLMALLVLGLIAVGWFMTGLPDGVSYRYSLYNWHKSIGVLVLFLVAIRLMIRWRSAVPAFDPKLSIVERRLAHLGHYALYGLMFFMPVSGYLMSNSYGFGVSFFGVALPRVFGKDLELAGLANQAHEIVGYVFLVFISLHALAVAKHWFKDGINVLKRIV